MSVKAIIASVLAAVVIFLGLSSLYIVNERQLALVVEFGDPIKTVDKSGMHFKKPFVQQVLYLDKRILSLDVPPQEVYASDQRRIVVDSITRFRITDALKAFQAARTEAQMKSRLKDILQSSVRQVLANVGMDEIVSGGRTNLMSGIIDLTNQRASNLGLSVIDVRLKRVDLPQQNSASIFDRMITERQREAAEKRAQGTEFALGITSKADREVAVLLANAERTSQIIRGEADGKAVKIFADAFSRDEEFFEFYRTMQAYKKALGQSDTTMVLSPDNEFLKLLNEAKKN